MTEDEVDEIAEFLGFATEDFIESYTRLSANRQHLSIIDKEGSDECVMLEDGGCKIHDVKPKQCRGFPNDWKFPNWRKYCEAVAVPIKGEA